MEEEGYVYFPVHWTETDDLYFEQMWQRHPARAELTGDGGGKAEAAEPDRVMRQWSTREEAMYAASQIPAICARERRPACLDLPAELRYRYSETGTTSKSAAPASPWPLCLLAALILTAVWVLAGLAARLEYVVRKFCWYFREARAGR